MQLHELSRPKNKKRPYRRVGRGQSSTRGKQSGRGGKGQTARAGNKKRPELRDIIKKLPKRRGYGKNRGKTHVHKLKPLALTLARISAAFEAGKEVTSAGLLERGIIARIQHPIKILGGEIDKKLSFKGIAVSRSARASIEKAGGTVA